jgi:flagellar biosynthetic protein FliR
MDAFSLLELSSALFGVAPAQLLRAGLMAARVLPLVVLVPVFGLRAAPWPIKGAMALALALSVAPVWLAEPLPSEPWLMLIFRELLLGLPVALGVAALLWAATMAGDLISVSARDVGAISFDALPGAQSAVGVLMSLLCMVGFLELGVPARVLRALASLAPTTEPLASRGWWLHVVEQVLAAINLALAIAAPLIAVAFVTHIAFALLARAALPVSLMPALPALRALVVLFLFAALFQAIAWVLFERIGSSWL